MTEGGGSFDKSKQKVLELSPRLLKEASNKDRFFGNRQLNHLITPLKQMKQGMHQQSSKLCAVEETGDENEINDLPELPKSPLAASSNEYTGDELRQKSFTNGMKNGKSSATSR